MGMKKGNRNTKRNSRKRTFSPYRQRIMSDENILFLSSFDVNSPIHDKTCLEARKIPDYKLQPLTEYNKQLPQCESCAIKSYIRVGAKDFYNWKNYEDLFEKMGFSTKLIRSMYVNRGMKTTIGVGVLTIWCKDDKWMLQLTNSKGGLRLLHNNYTVDKNGKRRIVSGFHVQVDPCPSAKSAIRRISEYDYEKLHCTQEEVKTINSVVSVENNGIKKTGIFTRIKEWFLKLFGKIK